MENIRHIEHLATTEAIDLGSARFIDRLESEHENLWTLLTSSIQTADESHYEIMTKLWEDTTFPMVFRDRAMLVLAGTWEVRRALNVASLRGGGFRPYSRPGLSIKATYPTGNTLGYANEPSSLEEHAKLQEWVEAALIYQNEHGISLLPDHTYMSWALQSYSRDLISEEKLQWTLDRIDVVKAMPVIDPDNDDYELPPDRFPLIDDILNKKIQSNPKLDEWAYRQLDSWLAMRRGENITLPGWLANISAQKGIDLYSKLLRKKGAGAAWPGIQHFGWEALLTDERNRLYRSDNRKREYIIRQANDRLKLAQKIEEPEIRLSLVGHILRTQAVRREADPEIMPLFTFCRNEDVSFVRQTISPANDQELKNLLAYEEVLFEALQQREAEDKAAYNAELKRLEKLRQAEAMKSPEYLARQRAKDSIVHILRSMKEIAIVPDSPAAN